MSGERDLVAAAEQASKPAPPAAAKTPTEAELRRMNQEAYISRKVARLRAAARKLNAEADKLEGK